MEYHNYSQNPTHKYNISIKFKKIVRSNNATTWIRKTGERKIKQTYTKGLADLGVLSFTATIINNTIKPLHQTGCVSSKKKHHVSSSSWMPCWPHEVENHVISVPWQATAHAWLQSLQPLRWCFVPQDECSGQRVKALGDEMIKGATFAQPFLTIHDISLYIYICSLYVVQQRFMCIRNMHIPGSRKYLKCLRWSFGVSCDKFGHYLDLYSKFQETILDE